MTARQALTKLLKEHGLTMIENSAHDRCAIYFQKLGSEASGSPDQFASKTNEVIPLMEMQEVPLGAALEESRRCRRHQGRL